MEDTNAFKKIGATYAEEPDDECSEFQNRSDDYWKCYVQQNTISWIHMVGTCRMGPDSDTPNDSVIDSKFRCVCLSSLVLKRHKGSSVALQITLSVFERAQAIRSHELFDFICSNFNISELEAYKI